MAGEAQHSKSPSQHNLTMSAAGLLKLGREASFRMQVSRTTFKVWLGPAQGQSAAFRFHEVHGLLVGHDASGIALVGLGQRGRKHEFHHFAAHDCGCVHGGKLLRPVLAFKPTFQGQERHQGCMQGGVGLFRSTD